MRNTIPTGQPRIARLSLNLFRYARNNPGTLNDPDGFAAVDPKDVKVVAEKHFTGKETLEELRSLPIPEGNKFNEEIGEDNYKNYYIKGPGKHGAGGIWVILVPDTSSGFYDGSDPGVPEIEAAPDIPTGEESPSHQVDEPPESNIEETAPQAARQTLQESARPTSETGARAEGRARTYSGEAKRRVEAKVKSGNGFMMDDIKGSPSWEFVRAKELELEITGGKPEARLTKPQMDRVWGLRSFKFVFKAAFSGLAVEGAGPVSKVFGQIGYIQGKFESLARKIGGGAAAGLMIGSGLASAYFGSQDENPYVATASLTAGLGEAMYGAVYGAAQWLGKANIAEHASKGGKLLGGVGAMIAFGVAAKRSYDRGDNVGVGINLVGALGGALLVAAAFTPVGWVALAGTLLIAGATGTNIFRALRS